MQSQVNLSHLYTRVPKILFQERFLCRMTVLLLLSEGRSVDWGVIWDEMKRYGTSKTTLSAVLKELQKKGVINKEKKRVFPPKATYQLKKSTWETELFLQIEENLDNWRLKKLGFEDSEKINFQDLGKNKAINPQSQSTLPDSFEEIIDEAIDQYVEIARSVLKSTIESQDEYVAVTMLFQQIYFLRRFTSDILSFSHPSVFSHISSRLKSKSTLPQIRPKKSILQLLQE